MLLRGSSTCKLFVEFLSHSLGAASPRRDELCCFNKHFQRKALPRSVFAVRGAKVTGLPISFPWNWQRHHREKTYKNQFLELDTVKWKPSPGIGAHRKLWLCSEIPWVLQGTATLFHLHLQSKPDFISQQSHAGAAFLFLLNCALYVAQPVQCSALLSN